MFYFQILTALVLVLTVVGIFLQFNGDLLKILILGSAVGILINVMARLMKAEPADEQLGDSGQPSSQPPGKA